MVLWVIRALFVVMIVVIVILGDLFNVLTRKSLAVAVVGLLTVTTLGLTVDLLVRRKSLAALAGVFFGLLAGSIVGLGFSYIVEFLYQVHQVKEGTDLYRAKDGIKLIIQVLCCYLAIAFILQTKNDFRFIIPYVEFSKQTKGAAPLVLDTSVIIDGRISDIASTRILGASMIVPRFVLNELQNIADSPDRLRRARGRRGLDVLNKMQSDKDIDIEILDVGLTSRQQSEPVDQKLVTTALNLRGKIVTNDYNLNKVASLRGVEVININDLANALKPVVLPGESMSVRVVKPGDQPGQGVGYMEDGTMIVVEQGRQFMNREVEIIVTSVLQTSAGRMIFGRLPDDLDNGNAAGSRGERANSRDGSDASRPGQSRYRPRPT
ncbi:MAG: PIN domain-containing protein [Sedimentisphaerales bacterium]|nr:PIN domain-containing protein [Sedimentisphaerales bacterium]